MHAYIWKLDCEKMLSHFKQSEGKCSFIVEPGNLEKNFLCNKDDALNPLLANHHVYLDIIRFLFRAHVFLWHKGDFTFWLSLTSRLLPCTISHFMSLRFFFELGTEPKNSLADWIRKSIFMEPRVVHINFVVHPVCLSVLFVWTLKLRRPELVLVDKIIKRWKATSFFTMCI